MYVLHCDVYAPSDDMSLCSLDYYTVVRQSERMRFCELI